MVSQLPPGTLIAPAGRVKAPAPIVRDEHKALGAYRTITEVAADLGVASHVLRFWESRFPQIKPLKKSGGRRYYKTEDVQLLRQIQHLLYDQGMTIRGVQAQLGKAKKAKVSNAQVNDTVWMMKELRRIRQVLAGEE